MEIYSTTLWHLQKDVALSALSKDLTDMDKNCPEVRASHRPGSAPSVLALRSTPSSGDVLSRPRSSVSSLLSPGCVGSESFNLSVCLQAWCVAGNCFSLQREHDIAIKFFQRAIQVSLPAMHLTDSHAAVRRLSSPPVTRLSAGGPGLRLCLHAVGSRVCFDRGAGPSARLLSKRHQSQQQALQCVVSHTAGNRERREE